MYIDRLFDLLAITNSTLTQLTPEQRQSIRLDYSCMSKPRTSPAVSHGFSSASTLLIVAYDRLKAAQLGLFSPVNDLFSLPTCPSGRVLGVATRGLSATASMHSFLRPNMVLVTCEFSLLAFNVIFTRSSLAGFCTSLFVLQRIFFARRE